MSDPRREAEARLEGRYEVRVLEPSPPALEGNLDDPTAHSDEPRDRQLVCPVSDGDVTWDALAASNEGLAAWCAERWLGAWRRLPPVPDGLVETRLALHRLAEEVVSPARREAAGGEISLRFTRCGFGTPFYADDRQVRVEGAELVVVSREGERRTSIESLQQCAEFVGDIDSTSVDADPLHIDPGAARFIGDWFGFTTLVVAELRARGGDGREPATINLWPEHFDVATELGVEADGARAGYGGSPGDEDHTEPYLYVAPWEAPPEGELWNATRFRGAELTYAELLEAEDQVGAALDFFEPRLHALTS